MIYFLIFYIGKNNEFSLHCYSMVQKVTRLVREPFKAF